MKIPHGFLPINADELSDLALKNAEFTVDEFSPFADPHALVWNPDESLIIDRHYGQAYHSMDIRPAAIYGRSADLPAYSGDQLANHGFLRVPFRRIPRRVVRNRGEIEKLLGAIESADDNLRIRLRGQTQEYLIRRSPDASQLLYGEDSVLEPSLQTSASRRKPALEEVIPEWCALLKLFLRDRAHRLGVSGYDQFTTSVEFPLFALALAQHYGLPTSGLDVTDSLDVALFFALMKFEKPTDSYEASYSRRSTFEQLPVLYVLSPSQQQQFDYEGYRAEGFPYGRPDAQSARFMHVGWGYSENACARRIFLALYLEPSGDLDQFPRPPNSFRQAK